MFKKLFKKKESQDPLLWTNCCMICKERIDAIKINYGEKIFCQKCAGKRGVKVVNYAHDERDRILKEMLDILDNENFNIDKLTKENIAESRADTGFYLNEELIALLFMKIKRILKEKKYKLGR